MARPVLTLLNAALILASIGTLASLVRGRVALSVVALVLVWLARLVVIHRHRHGRIFADHETTVMLAGLLVLYLANGHTLGGGDTAPARYLPLSILREGHFYLDRFPFLYARCVPYYLAFVHGHYLSAYPVAAALLALPIYVPAALAGVDGSSPVIGELEKLAAAVTVALSVIVLYRGARFVASRRMALLVAAAYALGSSSLSVSSQALWQHGASQLGLTGALYCLLRGRREARWTAAAGLPLAFAVIARPTDALIAAAVVAYVLLEHPRQLPSCLLAGVPPILFQFWYNVTYFADPFRTQWPLLDASLWSTPFWSGLAGLALSPGRGLFMYSPIFLLSVVGGLVSWRRGGDPLLRALGVGAGLTFAVYAKWHAWWGGYTFGPRLLADLSPVLALCLFPLEPFLSQRRSLGVITAVLLAASILAHAEGALVHDAYWPIYVDVDHFPERLWSWTDNPLVNPWRLVLGRAGIVLARYPTSRNSRELLSATYHLSLPAGASVAAGAPLEVSLTIVNDGRAAWLAWPRLEDGVVRLAWRWQRPGEAAPVLAEALPLYFDVPPGGSHSFHFMMYPPSAPSAYTLVLGLVRHEARCVSPFASPDVRVDVTVTPRAGAVDHKPGEPRACTGGPFGLPVPAACGTPF